MKRLKCKIAAITILIVAGGMVAANGATAKAPAPPPRPPWVNADNTVDMSKVPAAVPGVDSNGQLIIDKRTGKPVMFPVTAGPPALPEQASKGQNRADEVSRRSTPESEIIVTRPGVLVPPGRDR